MADPEIRVVFEVKADWAAIGAAWAEATAGLPPPVVEAVATDSDEPGVIQLSVEIGRRPPTGYSEKMIALARQRTADAIERLMRQP